MNLLAEKEYYGLTTPKTVEEVHPDLTTDLFIEALSCAYFEAVVNVNQYAPRNGRGQTMYVFATQNLRKALSRYPGWKTNDQNNIARIIHRQTGISIICSGGNENTGKMNAMPSTRSIKGAGTAQLVGQMSMFDNEFPKDDGEIWYFLYYIDAKNREIRCELSKPEYVQAGVAINRWSNRIILTPISLNPFNGINLSETTDKIDIPIEFKKAI